MAVNDTPVEKDVHNSDRARIYMQKTGHRDSAQRRAKVFRVGGVIIPIVTAIAALATYEAKLWPIRIMYCRQKRLAARVELHGIIYDG